jgi:hypothetical protein
LKSARGPAERLALGALSFLASLPENQPSTVSKKLFFFFGA